MSHLTPEQRPDKNGKVVTRHVNPNKGSSAKVQSRAAKLAPPSSPSAAEKAIDTAEGIVSKFGYSNENEYRFPHRRNFKKELGNGVTSHIQLIEENGVFKVNIFSTVNGEIPTYTDPTNFSVGLSYQATQLLPHVLEGIDAEYGDHNAELDSFLKPRDSEIFDLRLRVMVGGFVDAVGKKLGAKVNPDDSNYYIDDTEITYGDAIDVLRDMYDSELREILKSGLESAEYDDFERGDVNSFRVEFDAYAASRPYRKLPAGTYFD